MILIIAAMQKKEYSWFKLRGGDFMENIKILRKESFDIEMPRKVRIGDPMYFEEYRDYFQYVYSKTFKSEENWLGKLILVEEEVKYENWTIKDVNFHVALAPSKKLLDVYKVGAHYSKQKVVATEIGVDTACYLVEIDNRSITVNTGSDGLMGCVFEYYRGEELEGVFMDLSGLDINEFDKFANELKYVFEAI